MGDRDEVLHDVTVLGVTPDKDVLYVDLYGGEACICGSVRFTFPVARQRVEMFALLRRWAADAVPVTFIRTTSSVALEHRTGGHDDQIRASSV